MIVRKCSDRHAKKLELTVDRLTDGYKKQTDRQTDRQTDSFSTVLARLLWARPNNKSCKHSR